MIARHFIPLIRKQITRHPTRSTLTVTGVAVAMFLFSAVQALSSGVERATQTTGRDATLVVYRENRFCPFTSRLPEYYGDRIKRIEHVERVIPMKVVVNNCGVALNIITFRGLPEESVDDLTAHAGIIAGSIEEWKKRSDAALIGEALAARQGFSVGDSFDAAGVRVTVAGIVRSEEAQDQSVAYVHLEFLQRTAGKGGLGIVTQFNVVVDDPANMEKVAAAIDEEFRNDPEPTQTSPEKAFVARAAHDIVQIVSFTKWLGWACLVTVLALVGNAIILAVQDRVREHAILQTLGYRQALIARLIVAESLVLGVIGGGVGTLVAAVVLYTQRYSISNEGVTMNVQADLSTIVTGIAMSAALGVMAGIVPALQASRRTIASCFRAV